jgi:hypothetical protein
LIAAVYRVIDECRRTSEFIVQVGVERSKPHGDAIGRSTDTLTSRFDILTTDDKMTDFPVYSDHKENRLPEKSARTAIHQAL